MHWAGQPSGRIVRGKNTPPVCETRWIVPARPYQAPKNSMEYAENMILLGAGVVTIIFGFALIIASAM